MRERGRILDSLERAYRSAYRVAEADGDEAQMARLDLDYQRDQLLLEAVLDVRAILVDVRDASVPEEPGATEKAKALLGKARSLRNLTGLR